MEGARFLKFVYISREATSPWDVFSRGGKEKKKKTPWQTELTPPRRANFVCRVGRQPRRKFDQPTFLKRNVFKKNNTRD